MGEMFNQPSTQSIPQSLNQSVVENTARTLSARQGAPILQDLNSSMGPSLDEELNIDKSTLETLKGLYAAKERAVINEDFDEAKKLKVSIDRLKAISGHLGQLEDRKRLAIMNEDYDSAKLIKHEIDKLKESALKPAIADLSFPNIQNNNNNNN
jgi:hypothetical protein